MPWRLLWRNLAGHKLRSLLTLMSVAVAVFLLSVLNAANRGLDAAVAKASTTRLWVQSAVSLFVDLPASYEAKIASTPGVASAIRFQWFGGVYQDPSNFFAQFAVDPPKWLAAYPEVELAQGTADEWFRARTACIIGQDLASRFGWKVGDRVPLIGTIFPRLDGSHWEFDVVGIYRSKSVNIDQSTMYFHFDYLREAQEQGAVGGPPGVGVFLATIAPDTPQDAVIRAIEDEYANGPQRVRVTKEAEFQRQFITMLGSVPTLLASIGGGVLFAIFFAVLNTMLMAARERTRDLGILKALGFRDGTLAALLIAESVLLCVLGGSLGVLMAKGSERPLWSVMSTMIPGFAIDDGVLLGGLLLAAGIGLVAGLAPAWRARSLQPVTALRMEV